MKNYAPIILSLCALFLSCRKKDDVKPSVITTVSGRFYDIRNNEPYQNLKLMVGEYQETYSFYGASDALIGYRDSTTTDSNGNYKMTFSTSGKGNTYFLEFGNYPRNVYIADKGTNSFSFNFRYKLISNIGTANVYDFDVLRSYYMKTRVIVHDNPYSPVSITTWNSHFKTGGGFSISGKNNDTIVNIAIVKNAGPFYLVFYVTDPANQKFLSNNAPLLNPVINKDTIPGGQYDIYPATFK
jgi:hypothetical protein